MLKALLCFCIWMCFRIDVAYYLKGVAQIEQKCYYNLEPRFSQTVCSIRPSMAQSYFYCD